MSATAPVTKSIHIIGATRPREVNADLVGGKAFNLMLMSEAGLSVPPGFVLGTGFCRDFKEAGDRLEDDVVALIVSGIRQLEGLTGLRFGAGRRPLAMPPCPACSAPPATRRSCGTPTAV